MIIKRDLKSQMPTIKRCKLHPNAHSVCQDDDVSDSPHSTRAKKKRKLSNTNRCLTPNIYYPPNLLGEVAAGVIPVNLRGRGFSASWCTQVSCSPPEELETVSKKCKGSRDSKKGANCNGFNPTPVEVAATRPALVRTSRGRVQVLPSRFNDSVIDNWRKESKTASPGFSVADAEVDDGDVDDCNYDVLFNNNNNNHTVRKVKQKDKFSSTMRKDCNGSMKNVRNQFFMGHRDRSHSAFCEEIFDFKNFSSCSPSTLTSLHEQHHVMLFDDENYAGAFVNLSNLKE